MSAPSATEPNRYTVLWNQLPFVKLAMGFIPGMASGLVLGKFALVFHLAAGIVALMAYALPGKLKSRDRWPLMILSAFLLGTATGAGNAQTSRLRGSFTFCVAEPLKTICSQRVERPYGARLLLRPLDEGSIPARLYPQQIVAYLHDETSGSPVRPGDTVVLPKAPEHIRDPASPVGFNLARYYRRKGIFHSISLSEAELTIGRPKRPNLYGAVARIRSRNVNIITKHIRGMPSQAILAAMLLGVRSDIPLSVKDDFKRSGAMHILAISGLHVGIIASVLYALFTSPGRSKNRWRILATIVTIKGIWCFSLLSGMSPSAVRASCMLSLYLLANIFFRKSNNLNTLALSAVLLLTVSPGLIFNISFQYSYLALAGILIFGRPIFDLLVFRYRLLNYMWGIIAISVCAQIFTVPLSLYYFNETSLISPITSLFAIPAAYLLVIGGVLMILSELVFPPLATITGFILNNVIDALLYLLAIFSDVSASVITGVHLEPSELAVLLVIPVSIALRIMTNFKGWSIIALATATIFLVIHNYTVIHHRNRYSVTIYPSADSIFLDIIFRGNAITSFNTTGLPDFTRNTVETNRLSHYVQKTRRISFPIDSNRRHVFVQPGNILYVSGAYKAQELGKLVHLFDPHHLVSEYPIPFNPKVSLSGAGSVLDIRQHSLRHDGPFQLIQSR